MQIIFSILALVCLLGVIKAVKGILAESKRHQKSRQELEGFKKEHPVKK